ncbi:MAG: hypothetical protein GY803_15395 [Chloroflexi bacterium]|nr:hypothetical protein [Chloroflexota bacterium]
MEEIQDFTGLTMPVFTAFGWAGEETALNFALSQLEMFIGELHKALPRSAREKLPGFGLSRETQAVYLATDADGESGVHIAFYARPMSLEMQLVISDKKVLAKGLGAAEKQPSLCHRLVTELGPDWSLRAQQMQVNEETGEAGHHQDLFKDSITSFDEETAVAVISKAAYLNSEDQWVTPLYLSRRFPSEQIAAMRQSVITVLSEHIVALMPAFNFLTGQVKTRKSKTKPKPKVKSVAQADEPVFIDPEDGFVYVAELKRLHIRRGFINLTPEHWPFFAINSRTETRPVTIYYNGIYDKGSSMWRLVPNDQARIVLSLPVHLWIEEYFDANDKIQVTVRKLDEGEIQISLKPVG